MANLGLIGAIGGVGEGIMQNAKRKADNQDAEQKSRIDEAREQRLLTWKADIEAKQQAQAHKDDLDTISTTQGGQSVLNAEQQAALDARQNQELGVTQSEGDKNRASAEKIASMRTSGSESEASLKYKERFEPRTSTIKVTGDDGIPHEEDVTTIYDKDTKRNYIQQGDRFMAQGTKPEAVRPANSAQIDALMSNPDKAIEFLEKFQYLPARFVESMSNQRTNK